MLGKDGRYAEGEEAEPDWVQSSWRGNERCLMDSIEVVGIPFFTVYAELMVLSV